MNSFFINITKGLELKDDNESNANTFVDVLDAFNSHTSTERIRRTIKTNEKFSFQPVPEDLVRKIHVPFVTKNINISFENGRFPDELKLAEVSPIFKGNLASNEK